MESATPHQAIIYDFGGVIAQIDFGAVLRRWAELSGARLEELHARFTHGEAYQRHERDEIDMAAYCSALREDLRIELADEEFVDGWQRVFGAEIEPTVEIVRRLKGHVPQYLFSNTNLTHYGYFSRRYAHALELFDGIFTSCELRARKPDPEAFLEVARRIGVSPERILFLDDTAVNIEGARAVGMQAVLIRGPEDVAQALAPWIEELDRYSGTARRPSPR